MMVFIFFQYMSRLFSSDSRTYYDFEVNCLNGVSKLQNRESLIDWANIIWIIDGALSRRQDVLQVIDVDRYDLLQKAIIWNRLDLVKLLVERGCNCNNQSPQGMSGSIRPDEDNNRPLHLACFLGERGGQSR